MLDVNTNHYSLDVLKQNIYNVSLLDVLKTQYLNPKFVTKYILNPKYQFLEKDREITILDVLKYQPHITKMQLVLAIALFDQDDDSDEDFESISKRGKNN